MADDIVEAVPVNDPEKAGDDTSEHAVARSTHLWGTVVIVCGIVTTVCSAAMPKLTAIDPTYGAIAGVVMVAAGAVSQALTSMGYSASRANVKCAQIQARAMLQRQKGDGE